MITTGLQFGQIPDDPTYIANGSRITGRRFVQGARATGRDLVYSETLNRGSVAEQFRRDGAQDLGRLYVREHDYLQLFNRIPPRSQLSRPARPVYDTSLETRVNYESYEAAVSGLSLADPDTRARDTRREQQVLLAPKSHDTSHDIRFLERRLNHY